MPYHVAKSGQCPSDKPWAVLKVGNPKPLGCHPNKADAEKQMAALYANEPGLKSQLHVRQLPICPVATQTRRPQPGRTTR